MFILIPESFQTHTWKNQTKFLPVNRVNRLLLMYVNY